MGGHNDPYYASACYYHQIPFTAGWQFFTTSRDRTCGTLIITKVDSITHVVHGMFNFLGGNAPDTARVTNGEFDVSGFSPVDVWCY